MVMAQYRVNVIPHTIYQKTERRISDEKVPKDLCWLQPLLRLMCPEKFLPISEPACLAGEKISMETLRSALVSRNNMYIFKPMDSLPVYFIALKLLCTFFFFYVAQCSDRFY